MQHNAEFVRLVGDALNESKNMKPVRDRSPLVAFFAGFLFGPFGVGLYLRSWGDFIVSLGLVVLGTMMTAGLGAPFFWVLCGVWGAARAAGPRNRADRNGGAG